MKNEKKFSYIQGSKKYEIELTYDMFVDGLKSYMEYTFYYENITVDISFHYVDDTKIYEININGDDYDAERYEFDSIDAMLNHKIIGGSSLKEVWDDLRTCY